MKSNLKFVLGFSMLAMSAVFAETSAPTEYQIKAAFLYNFAKFVEWPPETFQNTSGSFVIGILGHDPFGSDLDNLLNGKTIQDKTLVLKRISDIHEASDCNVLFISSSKESELEAILGALKGRPVLTVSDIDQFVQRGGVVGFTVEDRRVRFSINTKVADADGLKISSQLLKLAKTIISRRLENMKYACLPFKPIPSVRS